VNEMKQLKEAIRVKKEIGVKVGHPQAPHPSLSFTLFTPSLARDLCPPVPGSMFPVPRFHPRHCRPLTPTS